MEKPILFNTEMVKAIMGGRKTVTRRIIKDVNDKDFIGFVTCSTSKSNEGKAGFGKGSFEDIANANIDEYVRPPYKVGDILYVRETWQISNPLGDILKGEATAEYVYKAGYSKGKRVPISASQESSLGVWKPSIHMPKEAARIFLRVTNVRVERLQDISTEQTLKEGVIQRFPNVNDEYTPDVLRGGFIGLWNSTIKDSDYNNYSYKANPWVWVIELKE